MTIQTKVAWFLSRGFSYYQATSWHLTQLSPHFHNICITLPWRPTVFYYIMCETNTLWPVCYSLPTGSKVTTRTCVQPPIHTHCDCTSFISLANQAENKTQSQRTQNFLLIQYNIHILASDKNRVFRFSFKCMCKKQVRSLLIGLKCRKSFVCY